MSYGRSLSREQGAWHLERRPAGPDIDTPVLPIPAGLRTSPCGMLNAALMGKLSQIVGCNAGG